MGDFNKTRNVRAPRNSRVWALAALAGVALGALVTLLLVPSPTPAWVASDDPAATIDVVSQPYVDQRQVATTPTKVREYTAVSAQFGVVRRSDCTPGQVFSSGTAPFLLDASPILLLHTEVPLWRELSSGVRGDDVASLEAELVRLGYEVTVDDYFDYATGVALQSLWGSVGVTNRSTLPFSSFVWLPDAQMSVRTCDAKLGDQASPGAPLFTANTVLESLQVGLGAGVLQGQREAYIGSASTPIPEDGVITDPEFLALLTATRAFSDYQSGSSDRFNVNVRLVTSVNVTTVPASSLYGITGREACVVSGGKPLPVLIVASEFGQTLVYSDPLPTSVLMKPVGAAPCR